MTRPDALSSRQEAALATIRDWIVETGERPVRPADRRAGRKQRRRLQEAGLRIAAASEPMLGIRPRGQRPATDGERPPSAPPWCHSWPV